MNLLFVSLSDLHLGEEDSLLTNLSLGEPVPEPRAPGPCMLALVNYLHAVKRWVNKEKSIPFLILNGDIIELAITSYPLAVAYFRLFLTEIAKRKLFDRLIYIPGNHDHALWSLVRDLHFIHSLSRQPELPKQPEVEHVTQLSIPRKSTILEMLGANLPMEVTAPPLLIANPAFRLQSLEGREFLFHHGHLMEDLYKMSSLLRDRILSDLPMEELKKKFLRTDLREIEVENWPWIDFIWSSFARAGRVGKTLETFYELLSNPEGIETLVQRVTEIIRTDFNIPFVPEFFEDDLIRFVLRKALEQGGIGSHERADPTRPAFNDDIKMMVVRFISHYMKKELADEGLRPSINRTCFLFGHTHKPFMDELHEGEVDFGTVAVINSGGWVVESEEFRPGYGPGIIIGSNSGDLALVTYKLDVKPGSNIQKKGTWDKTLDLLREHEELEKAISKAVSVRQPYLKKRIKDTRILLENLSK